LRYCDTGVMAINSVMEEEPSLLWPMTGSDVPSLAVLALTNSYYGELLIPYRLIETISDPAYRS